MSYIPSSANRFYAAIETHFGQAQPVASGDRLIGNRLQIKQVSFRGNRRDKNGSRSFTAGAAGSPKTAFEFKAELTSGLPDGTPCCAPLFEATLGGDVSISSGLTIAAMTDALTIQTEQPHGLLAGSGISFGGELRFVTNVVDAATVQVNAPFTSVGETSMPLNSCATYATGTRLPSLTIYDYWDPASTVSRLIAGASVNELLISVAGNGHGLTFSGPAADVVDASSLTQRSGLTIFPPEPQISNLPYVNVAGNTGQVWLGLPASERFTMTSAAIQVKNNIQMRGEDMGSAQPLALQPGARQVNIDITLVAQSDTGTASLYQFARSRATVPLFLQLGSVQGQMMAMYFPEITLAVPEFDDAQDWLSWHFQGNWAKGSPENEVHIAFA